MSSDAGAAITDLAPTGAGLSVTATANYEAGIGRADFVLVDLTSEPFSDAVDRKDVDFARSPTRVTEAWQSAVSLAPGIAYRLARIEDAAEIHALLLRLAPEIPLLVDTLEREEALYALIRNCGRVGESWVALDKQERIVGFVLIDPEVLERHYAEHEIFDLRYAGVAPEHRGHGIFRTLIAKVQSRLVPVTVIVPLHNRLDVAARLEKFGFRQTGSPGGEQHLRWEPGA